MTDDTAPVAEPVNAPDDQNPAGDAAAAQPAPADYVAGRSDELPADAL